MTEKQIEILLKAQVGRYFMDGAGDYSALRALHERGHVVSPNSIIPSDITESGWAELAAHFPEPEIRQIGHSRYIVAKGGRVYAQMISNDNNLDALRSA